MEGIWWGLRWFKKVLVAILGHPYKLKNPTNNLQWTFNEVITIWSDFSRELLSKGTPFNMRLSVGRSIGGCVSGPPY